MSRWECSSMYMYSHSPYTPPHIYTHPPTHTPTHTPTPTNYHNHHTQLYAVGPKKKSTMIANNLANDFRKTKMEPGAQVRTPKNIA